MAELEDLGDRYRTYEEIIGTPIDKPFRVHLEEEGVAVEPGKGSNLTGNQRDWIVQSIARNEEVLAQHLEDSKQVKASLINLDKAMSILTDPKMGYLPRLELSLERNNRETAEIRTELSKLTHDVHNGLSETVKETKDILQSLFGRIEGCEEDIVALKVTDSYEKGTDEGEEKKMRVIGRRKEDRYRNVAIGISASMAVVSTISAVLHWFGG